MPGEKPTIEELERDIVDKPQEDWEKTVEAWHKDQLEKIRNGKYDDATKKRLEEELGSAREKMLADAQYAREKHDKKYSDGIAVARQFLEQTKKEAEQNPEATYKKLGASRDWAINQTDPDRKGDTVIDDYPGTGYWNEMSDTRFKLSGYLAALKQQDEAKKTTVADGAYNEAFRLFDGHFDKCLAEEDLMDKMGLQKYVDVLIDKGVNIHRLGAEALGYLAGLLKTNDLNGSDQKMKEDYKNYLCSQVMDLLAAGKLDFDPQKEIKDFKFTGLRFSFPRGGKEVTGDSSFKGELETLTNPERGMFQLKVMSALKAPYEWVEQEAENQKKLGELRKDYDALKKTAFGISADLKFNYEDTRVRTLLGKDPEQIVASDEEEIKYSKEKVRDEAFAKIEEAYKKVYPDIQEFTTRIGQIEAKNKDAKKLADQEVADVRTRVDAVKQMYDGIELKETDDLETLVKTKDAVVQVTTEADVLKKKMDAMAAELNLETPGAAGGAAASTGAGTGKGGEKSGGETPATAGPDRYLNDWDKAELVECRFKNKNLMVSPNANDVVFRDDKGKILGKIPAGTAVELVDVSAKGRKIGDATFVKVTYKIRSETKESILSTAVEVWVDESQLELVEAPAITPATTEKGPESAEVLDFMNGKNLKEVPFQGKFFFQLGDATSTPLAKGSPVCSSGNYEVDSKFLQNYVFKKLTEDERVKANALFNEARQASQFSFDHQPTRVELQDAYDKKFVTVWDYVARYGSVPGKETAVGGKETPAGGAEVAPGAANVPPELAEFAKQFQVCGEYREALARMARDAEKPEGALFEIPFNKQIITCRLMRVSEGNYVINWIGGSATYNSLRDAMIAVNDGHLIAGMTYWALRMPSYYKPYEKMIDKLDVKRMGDTGVPGEVQFELNWKWGGNRAEGNPVVVASATDFGGIAFRVYRDYAGLRGENVRTGFAANFDDFMQQLAHIKDWAEDKKYKEKGNKGQLAYNKEYNFSILSDPRNFYTYERWIGRPVYFGLMPGRPAGSEVVQMRLDWGGSLQDTRLNPLVNLWVNEAGTLSYTVQCDGRRIYPVETRVTSMAEIVSALTIMREAATAA